MKPQELTWAVTDQLVTGQGRTFGPDDMDLWYQLLSDLDPKLARQATQNLLRNSNQFITIALIRQEHARLVKERMDAFGELPSPPSGLDGGAYIRWRRALIGAVVEGKDHEEAVAISYRAVDALPPASSRPNRQIGQGAGDETVSGVVVFSTRTL